MACKKAKTVDSINREKSKAKLAAIAEQLGREIRIFTSSSASTSSDFSASNNEEQLDDFYDLTPEDFYRITSNKSGGSSQVLKTRKIREAEATASRERFTKATIRVHFPDDFILETEFHPSEKIQSLVDLLNKVVARPDMPFYLFITPPRERIKDMSEDFYSAGFVPGAIVYFSYDLPKESLEQSSCLYLRDEILSLNGKHVQLEQVDLVSAEPEPVKGIVTPVLPGPKPVMSKTTKPKWFKVKR